MEVMGRDAGWLTGVLFLVVQTFTDPGI